MIIGFGVWPFTVAGLGYCVVGILARRRVLEHMATGFLIGAAALPLLLFATSIFLDIPVLARTAWGRAGVWIFSLLITSGVAVTAVHHTRVLHTETTTRSPCTHRGGYLWIADILLVIAILAYLFQIFYGTRLFGHYGWDEYSFWLYAAKALYLSSGSGTVLRQDAFATYPLGFPYLMAWCYRLTGGVSFGCVRLIAPMLTTTACLSIYLILQRLALTRTSALLAVAMSVWGCYPMLRLNWVGFGEIIYVDIFTLGVVYVVAWMKSRLRTDLWTAASLLGLSCFLRTDGVYIMLITVFLFVCIQLGAQSRCDLAKQWKWPTVAIVLPALLWQWFLIHYHVQTGWMGRLSSAFLWDRMQPSFIQGTGIALWHTISNMSVYPITIVLGFLALNILWFRRTEFVFLISICLAQIMYLWIAYLTMFPVFEGLHASSSERYLMRIDPLTAIAFALWVDNLGASTRRVESEGAHSKAVFGD